jgi:hypothetical protein
MLETPAAHYPVIFPAQYVLEKCSTQRVEHFSVLQHFDQSADPGGVDVILYLYSAFDLK